jgi:hypothetical protein
VRRKGENLSLTPLKALGLLPDLVKARHSSETTVRNWALDQAIRYLSDHVKHGLRRKRSR